jgi:hypothetical protein
VELIRMASAVVEVSVLRTAYQEQSAVGTPLTVATLKVKKAYKGELPAGAETTVEFFGGPQEAHWVVSPGQPQLDPGDSAILLLTRPREGSANWRVLGGDVGLITLSRNEAGECVAGRASGQFDYYVRDGASTTGCRRVTSSVLGTGQLEELLTTIVRTGRPVLENCLSASPVQVWPAPAATLSHQSAPAVKSHSTPLLSKLLFVFVLTTLAWFISCRIPGSFSRH